MGSKNHRDVTRDFELDQLIRCAHRLSRHLSDHLNGEVAAIDDVAAVMRTLCAKGKGDKLLMRVTRSFGLPTPNVYIRQAIAPQEGTILEVGGFPSLKRYKSTDVEMSLLDWLDSPAIVTSRNLDSPYPGPCDHSTWQMLINDLANVRGSHATQTIASWLDAANIGGVHDLTLADYIVETAAVIVEDALARILPALGHAQDAPVRRLIPVRAIGIEWMSVLRSSRDKYLIAANTYTSGWDVPDGWLPAIRCTIRGLTFGCDVHVIDGVTTAMRLI